MKKILSSVFLFSLVMITGCSSSEEENINSSFYETKWMLRAFSDSKVYSPESKEDAFIVFSKNGTKANGFGGCNNFNMVFSKNKQKIKFENIAATEKFCESFMDQEKKYVEVLVNADSFRIKDNQLYFYGNGKIIARFENPGAK